MFDYQFGGPNGGRVVQHGDILGTPLGAGFRAALGEDRPDL
ncbi:MAG: hypothetical protein U0736_11675 [Gemmataceae bacterium]